MTPEAARHQEPSGLERLRIERRSYIVGTLLVWVVILAAQLTLLALMFPGILHQPSTAHASQAVAAAEKAMTQQQRAWLGLVQVVGAVALFILNWRFSLEIRRPRGAFPPPNEPGRYPAWRWLWWSLLAVNSYFFLPQVVVTPVMAHWGKQELAERAETPPTGTDSNSGPNL